MKKASIYFICMGVIAVSTLVNCGYSTKSSMSDNTSATHINRMAMGPSTSGGGYAMVCRDSSSRIISAELLDLYEAREKFKFPLPTPTGSIESDYIRAAKNTYRLQGYDSVVIGSVVRRSLDRFLKVVIFLRPGEKLPLLHDIGETIAPPKGCDFEQVAIFNDEEDNVKVDTEIWSKLDSLSQAALVTHEIYYRLERNWYEKTSEGTRAFVAHVYASAGVTPVQDGLPDEAFSCSTSIGDSGTQTNNPKNSRFWVYGRFDENDQPVIILQLFNIMGRPIITKATVELPGIGWLLSTRVGDKSVVVIEEGANKTFKVHIKGSQRNDWDLEVQYKFNQTVKIGLYQKGVLLEESLVSFCIE